MDKKKKNRIIIAAVIAVIVIAIIIYLRRTSKSLPKTYQDKVDAAEAANTGKKIPIDCSSMTDAERAAIMQSNVYTCK